MKALLALASILVCAAPARSQTLFADDFEAGLGNWTTTGIWHLQNAADSCSATLLPFPSGTGSLWYGHNQGGICSFQTTPWFGNATMTTPVLLAGTRQSVWLRYENFLSTEFCSPFDDFGQYDRSTRWISLDGGQTWEALRADCTQTIAGWEKGRADLTPYLGQSVLLRFDFDSGDGIFDHGLGWWIDDVEIRLEAGTPTCDASPVCPCDNFNHPGHWDEFPGGFEDPLTANIGGCHHSEPNKTGAELWAQGIPSLTQNVVLNADDLSLGTTVLVVQASAPTAPFAAGDGLSCLGGALLRLAVRPTHSGAISYPQPSDPPLAATATANTTIGYQVYYRNANPTWCTPATFNFTNAYLVHWAP